VTAGWSTFPWGRLRRVLDGFEARPECGDSLCSWGATPEQAKRRLLEIAARHGRTRGLRRRGRSADPAITPAPRLPVAAV
jgi:hypothetical protein